MAPTESSRLDIVVFGATGFTGKYAILEVFKLAKEKGNMSWGISGRNKSKLEAVLKEMGAKAKTDFSSVPIILADVEDNASLEKMAARARVVVNCAGPYWFYGEAVVKACIASGAHHVDISGEPHYMERMQLLYHKAAEEKGIYIISACGFDSIPGDLGILHFSEKFGGDVNSVETYLEISVNEGTSMSGAWIHYGTWISIINFLANEKELIPLNKKLYPTPMPMMQPKLKRRFPIHKRDEIKGWCMPQPDIDRSVVSRTQRHFLDVDRKRPVQMYAYFALESLVLSVAVALIVIVVALLSKFSLGTTLLLKFPRFFSCGFVSHDGPREEFSNNFNFSFTYCLEGWSDKLAEPTDQHTKPPNKKLVGKVTGTNPAYGATNTALVMAAIMCLTESDKMPGKGGVYPPGAAFAKTSLVKELDSHGLKFTIVSTGK